MAVSASMWRNRDFVRYWVGHTVSQLGSEITELALPLVALLQLGASSGEASCSAGTLSFDFRMVIPPSGVEVTVNGTPVSLKKAIVLTGSVTVSTASISDPSVAGRAGALICQLDSLLKSGASLEAIVDKLNQLLRVLA